MSLTSQEHAEWLKAIRPAGERAPITPVSSPEDKRHYRVVTLDNGLTAALVSDPDTDKAAASMDVNVGHFSDPAELPGLAHFLEHMLFLGTEKYPDEASYSTFLSSHGGSSNAYTSTENTNYFFDVTKNHLAEALDRFAQFFIAPLFTPSCVDRELNAVHNENAKNLQVDTWRMFQLLKSTSSRSHPFSKFGTGNHATLRDGPKAAGIDVRTALLKFHKDLYSSHIMRLSVIGRESLDELEALVRAKFSAIPRSTNALPPVFGHEAMTPNELGRLIHVIPIKDSRSLQLLWHFDTSVQHLYDKKPLELLSHCLGHESTGSIFSYLKKLGYANGLSAGVKSSSSSFTLFTVSVDLTEQGLEHTSEIAEIIFSYLKHVLLASLDQSPEKWRDEIYREVAAVNAMSFQFKGKESPISLVSALSHAAQVYPPERILNGPYELRTYDAQLLRYFLTALTATSNLRVHLVGQKFERELKEAGKTLQHEEWYNTTYLNEPLPESLLMKLREPRVYPELALPRENKFIATDFELRHARFTDAEIAAKKEYAPMKLEDADLTPGHSLSQVWFKADRTFALPKANILMRILIPLAYQSPKSTLLTNLYAQLLTDALNEYSYDAAIAGLSFNFYATQQGLQLGISGYSQKQGTLLTAILAQMKSLRIVGEKEADFARLKEQLKRGLLNFKKGNPYEHAVFDEVHALEETLWSHAEKLGVIDSLTPAHLDAFAAELLSHGETELFVHGNLLESDARVIAKQVAETLQLKPLFASQLPLNRVVQLSSDASYLRQCAGLNPDDANSASLGLYQLGENTVELHAIAELFSHIIKTPLFDALRTKEQLGYLVWSNLVVLKGVLHFRILLQSSNASADYLNYRCEAFLQWFRDVELPRVLAAEPDFFAKNVAAVIAKKQEKDKTLGAESNRLWNEISLHRYQFDRVEREVAILQTLDERALFAFIDRYIAMRPNEGHSERRKFNIQYFGNKHQLPAIASFETEERVAFANQPVPAEKNATAGSEVDVAPVVADNGTREEGSPAAPLAAAETIVLSRVPVDPRPIRMVQEIDAFKRAMPLFPSFQS